MVEGRGDSIKSRKRFAPAESRRAEQGSAMEPPYSPNKYQLKKEMFDTYILNEYNICIKIMENAMNKIIEITDFLAPELDVYARLTEVQLLNREFPEKGLFIAESPKVIERALDAEYEPVSCLMDKRHIEGEGKPILERIKDVPVFCAEFDVLTQLTGFKLTRGMLCAMKRKPLPDVNA